MSEWITLFRDLSERLSQIDSEDREEIIPIGAEIERLISKAEESGDSPLSDLLALTLEGLLAFFQGGTEDPEGLLQRLAELHLAVAESLENPDQSESGTLIEKLSGEFQSLLESAVLGEPSSDGASIEAVHEPVRTSSDAPILDGDADESDESDWEITDESDLDDLASRFMFLDLSNRKGFTRLQSVFLSLAKGEIYPEVVRRSLEEASVLAGRIASGDAENPSDAQERIGRLIESAQVALEAMELKEKIVKASETPPASVTGTPSATIDASSDAVAEKPSEGAAARFVLVPSKEEIDLLREFIQECRELIEGAEAALLVAEADSEDLESINTVFRAFHTIKSAAGFLSIEPVSALSHRAESLLTRIRDGEIRFTQQYADISLQAIDFLRFFIDSVESEMNGEEVAMPDGYDDFMALLSEAVSSDESTVLDVPSVAIISKIETVADPIESEKVVVSPEPLAPSPALSKPLAPVLSRQTLSVLDGGGKDEHPVVEEKAIRARKTTAGEESSVRVRTDRLDLLIEMVGELVIAQSMVVQDPNISSGSFIDLARKVAQTGKIVRELQDLSLSMRMIPFKGTFQKLVRLARDLSYKCGKSIQFLTEGEETEIDRNMVDVISDPLVHMIRNAVDHGIEPPEVREKAGKPTTGTISLRAYPSGDSVAVEIRDDGQGLNLEKIRAKGLAKGLIEADRVYADQEIYNLIFHPGFSTVEQVTDVSGRGVGMDVVKKGIEALKGKVEIVSEPGKGTTFTMKVPLTLAITDGMVIRVGEERYIVPTANIHVSFRPGPQSITTVVGRGEMVAWRDNLMPIFRLHRLFEIPKAVEDPTKGLLIVVGDTDRRCALLVDEIAGQQQVVAKSLGTGLGEIPGVSGGAILGDGRVGLILDTSQLTALARQSAS